MPGWLLLISFSSLSLPLFSIFLLGSGAVGEGFFEFRNFRLTRIRTAVFCAENTVIFGGIYRTVMIGVYIFAECFL